VLSAALAGKGEAMIRNGDKSGGTGMLRRSAEMAALATSEADKDIKRRGEYTRKRYLDT
jgi:hypothetical protein